MDYNDKTDFEINKMVAERLGLNVLSVNPHKTSSFDLYGNETFKIHGAGSTIQVLILELIGVKTYGYFDYCNNPEDAWPIILENRISLISSNGGYYATDDVDSFLEPDGKAPWDKKPLRAVCICFLMMSDNKGN